MDIQMRYKISLVFFFFFKHLIKFKARKINLHYAERSKHPKYECNLCMHVLYVMNISRFKVLSLILACLYLIKSEEKEKKLKWL